MPKVAVGLLMVFLVGLFAKSAAQAAPEGSAGGGLPRSKREAKVPELPKGPPFPTSEVLGGVVGFGTGAWVANKKWTWTSTRYALMDTVLGGALAGLLIAVAQPGTLSTVGQVGLFVWGPAFLVGRLFQIRDSRLPSTPGSLEGPSTEPAQATFRMGTAYQLSFAFPVAQF